MTSRSLFSIHFLHQTVRSNPTSPGFDKLISSQQLSDSMEELLSAGRRVAVARMSDVTTSQNNRDMSLIIDILYNVIDN